jgi:hypothetical protein
MNRQASAQEGCSVGDLASDFKYFKPTSIRKLLHCIV